jgi:hypothetical protein
MVNQLVKRLMLRFPSVTRSHVTETVMEEYDVLAENPIRTYVPNLVEHAARARLTTEARLAA